MNNKKNKEEPTCQRLGAASCSTEEIMNGFDIRREIEKIGWDVNALAQFTIRVQNGAMASSSELD